MTRFLVLALVACACHHEASAPAPAAPANTQRSESTIGVIDDPLAFLPADSDAALGADFERLRASQAWHEQLEPLLKQGAAGPANDIPRKCGYDPATQITRISVAFKELDKRSKDTTLVIHGIDAQKLECAVTASGQSVRHDGSVVLASDAKASTVIAAMAVSPDTVLVNIAPNASRASIESRLRSGAPLRKVLAFMTSFGRLESEASAWAVINPSLKSFFGPGNVQGPKSTGIDMAFTVTDRYVLVARIGSATANDTAKWAQLRNALSARSQGWVEKLDVKHDGTLVRFEVLMNLQQTQTILMMLAGAVGLI